jgi:hypothetical protein
MMRHERLIIELENLYHKRSESAVGTPEREITETAIHEKLRELRDELIKIL